MGLTPGGLGLPTATVYCGCLLTMLMFDWAMPTATLIRVVGGAGGGGGGGGTGGGGWARWGAASLQGASPELPRSSPGRP